MKLSIVMLSTSMGMGGADRQILYLARALLAKGYDLQIVSMTPLGPMGLEAQVQGLPVHSLNMQRGVPDPIALLRLVNLLRQWQPQILHSHMVHANLMARVTRFLIPIPVVVTTAHNINEGGKWAEIAYRLTGSWCDLTTQVSQAGVERYVHIKAVPEHKIRLTPNTVDNNQFCPNLEVRQRIRQELALEEKFVWLAVGRYHQQKDYPNMLKAFAQVVSQYPDALLLIAGDALLGSDVETLANSLGINSNVQFLGVRRDVPALMNGADAYVMSSAWEGMPMVLLEASATGLPIVATDVGGNREVVLDGESGFLVPPQAPIALGKAMLRLMELPPDRRRQMGEVGRSHAESKYSIEQIVKMWENLYRELLAKKDCH